MSRTVALQPDHSFSGILEGFNLPVCIARKLTVEHPRQPGKQAYRRQPDHRLASFFG